MDLENQCCTFEQSFKLKELGVKYLSALFWNASFKNTSSPPDQHNLVHRMICGLAIKSSYESKTYLKDMNSAPAFTAADLAVMLPTYNWAIPIFEGKIKKDSDVYQEVKIQINLLHNPSCNVVAFDGSSDYIWIGRSAQTLAQAMAGLLIDLIEMELISVEDINKSLLK